MINSQINDEYKIFLGIFWQKFGTPTNRYESGTVEEYENAKRKYKADKDNTHILMYFKTEGNQNIYDIDLNQLQKVKEFKNKISSEDGILYAEFERTEDLQNAVRLNLVNLIRDKFSKKENQLPRRKLIKMLKMIINLINMIYLQKKLMTANIILILRIF